MENPSSSNSTANQNSAVPDATPRPWHFEEWKNADGERLFQLFADDRPLGMLNGDNAVWLEEGADEANAKLIVRAVNAHDALVEAATFAEEVFSKLDAPVFSQRYAVSKLQEALRLARG